MTETTLSCIADQRRAAGRVREAVDAAARAAQAASAADGIFANARARVLRLQAMAEIDAAGIALEDQMTALHKDRQALENGVREAQQAETARQAAEGAA